jgi:hypothetical protein
MYTAECKVCLSLFLWQVVAAGMNDSDGSCSGSEPVEAEVGQHEQDTSNSNSDKAT